MRRSYLIGLCALVAVLAAATAASAATIDLVERKTVNPKVDDVLAAYGSYFYQLTWDYSTSKYTPDGFRPTTAPTYGPANPANLIFNQGSSNGGGGGGGGGSDGPVLSTYNIGNALGGAWEMDFAVLLYDPEFDDQAKVVVQLVGRANGSTDDMQELTAAEVRAGTMVKWHLEGLAGELVDVFITSTDPTTRAVAGFFMDLPNFTTATPEPATMALVALGVAGLLARRRK